ncbi:hypothetical protein K435DRAFT_879435 [Dendrothele bispora CBS 962.96]|uniref:Uncharacterized protein n=1 Tax=Dendrothele bispora (strain CBS 962.96) TaxID=1314807 RepID=A0A4S8KL92_DENBC|nr:hypothetical protein K435DRAFT_879435 [Dendrothele bispora CBS 962.96]
MHCVFYGVYSPPSRPYDQDMVAVIALGLRTEAQRHKSWVDISVLRYGHSIYEIWKAYLPSGHRYRHAKLCTTKASVLIKLEYGQHRALFASVERSEFGLSSAKAQGSVKAWDGLKGL